MRYLYGDSTPAPLQFNFLATVEELVVCAATVIQIDHELRGLENGAAQAALTRGKALESLDRYHRGMMQSLRETSARSLEPHTLGYADALGTHAAQYVEEVRVATQALMSASSARCAWSRSGGASSFARRSSASSSSRASPRWRRGSR